MTPRLPMNEIQRAILRMLLIWPVHPPPPGSIEHWDLVTSTNDARAALTLALGGRPDSFGYRLPEATPAVQLELFEAAA